MTLPTRLLVLSALVASACGEPPAHDASTDAPATDSGPDTSRDALRFDAPVGEIAPIDDTTSPPLDAAEDIASDTAAIDAGFDSGSVDASDVTVIDVPTDTGAADVPMDVPADVPTGPQHVHILIDNFCNTSVSPMSVTVPVSSRTMFSFHNHSVDYNADVWMSYGGGYLDLATGATWNDPIGHCNTPTMHDEYADISIAGGGTSSCPGVRFMIHCR